MIFLYFCTRNQRMRDMRNPFIINDYAGPEYFCDRVEETAFLTRMLTNENNIALISPRRIGKTDLIRHTFEQEEIKNGYYTFLIDIYSTRNIQDFVCLLGKCIINTLKGKGRKAIDLSLSIVSSLRSEVSFDINGNPVWAMGMGTAANSMVTLDEIFSYLQHADKPCLVAIDEFQQITYYEDGPSVEASLRTYIQRCTNAHFIFSGSHRHLMGEMFVSSSRPFYQSVTIFNLKPLPLDKYQEFAQQKFADAGKQLADDVVPILYERFNRTTSYMQKILNYLFQITERGTACTSDTIDEAIRYILSISSDTYENLLYQMPEKQKNVLLAIARDRRAKGISGGNFAKRHHLPSPSSVVSAVRGLLEKDFIIEEKGEYWVYDHFLQLWLEENG